jgi:Uma2 family endonuclease
MELLETYPLSFDQFIHWYPDFTEQKYELHDGAIVEMPKPTGKHLIVDPLSKKLDAII